MNAMILLSRNRMGKEKRSKKDMFWATVRIENCSRKGVPPLGFRCEDSTWTFLSYDTSLFRTEKEARDEARAFCQWKGLRIVRYEKRDL